MRADGDNESINISIGSPSISYTSMQSISRASWQKAIYAWTLIFTGCSWIRKKEPFCQISRTPTKIYSWGIFCVPVDNCFKWLIHTHPHSISIQYVSFSFLRLACLFPASLTRPHLSTLTPLQTHDNISRTLYSQEDLHRGPTHSESLFLWSHGRRHSSIVLSSFHLLPTNHISHLLFKYLHGNSQQHDRHTSTLNCYSLGSLDQVVQSHLTHAIFPGLWIQPYLFLTGIIDATWPCNLCTHSRCGFISIEFAAAWRAELHVLWEHAFDSWASTIRIMFCFFVCMVCVFFKTSLGMC